MNSPTCPAGSACHHMPGCTDTDCPGHPAHVAKVKASHPAPPQALPPEADAPEEFDALDFPMVPTLLAVAGLVLWAIGSGSFIAGIVLSH